MRVLAPKIWEEYERQRMTRLVNQQKLREPSPMIQYVKEALGNKSLVGVEIGVAGGGGSLSMLRTLNISRLYLVDPYSSYVQDGRSFDYSAEEQKAVRVLRPYSDKVVFLRNTSDKAAKEIEDPLDFVYIDGNHSYLYVKNDLEEYYPKIKVGGIVGGHDFDPGFLGVVRAVVLFAERYNLKIKVSSFAGGTDWWIVKNEVPNKIPLA